MQPAAILDELSARLETMRFGPPVTHVYHPLVYARQAFDRYGSLYGRGRPEVLLLGMNPGPWGMAQTGVPFGEVAIVKSWLGLDAPVGKPDDEHPKRPIEGLACTRSEVSGRRLWGLFAERFGAAESFFAEHLVLNHCPLVFMEDTGRNRTPDKLPVAERKPLLQACDEALDRLVDLYRPEWCVGVGGYAEKRLQDVAGDRAKIGKLLHPSPASPIANRGWAPQATRQLVEQGIWRED